MLELCIFSASFLATYFGVAWFRSWSVNRGILDVPNERSSHVSPTPRGGGIVVALVTLAAYVIASFLIPFDLSFGFLIGASLIVVVSWLDDVYTVPFFYRLIVHAFAAAILIFFDGYASAFTPFSGGPHLDIGWLGAVLTFGWIVWMVNAYNFMDGIDGIAGVQALTAGLGWFLIGLNWNLPVVTILGGTCVFVGFAFLLHNWPPARIFMGDAGDAFLGFVFASLPMLAKPASGVPSGELLVAGVLLVWLFVFDSVFTFIRRAIRFERVWQAHREHLYQRLVIASYSHKKTTLLYGFTSIIVSAITVYWISSQSVRGLVILASVVLSQSFLILLLCLKRNCLFGKVS